MKFSLPKSFLINLSIKNRLIVYMMATSFFSVFLVGVMFYVLICKQIEKSYYKELQNLLTILGHNCQAALVFDVPKDAEAVLNSLEKKGSIVAAYIFDEQGELFAFYENQETAKKQAAEKESFLQNSGYYSAEASITMGKDSTIGKILIYDDIRDISRNNRNTFFLLALASFTALLAALFLANYLRNIISKPLHNLTEKVQKFASGNFSVMEEAPPFPSSRDEIGLLTISFNSMGHQLQNSYMQLERYSLTLENMVHARTLELEKTLKELKNSQSQLVHSEKMAALGHLVSGVAHEINNNINFITNVLPIIGQLAIKMSEGTSSGETAPSIRIDGTDSYYTPSSEKVKKMVQNAIEGVWRTQKIVQDLNSFARPSEGVMTYTDINNDLEAILTLLQYDLAGRIEVIRDFSSPLPLLSCVQDQINQVLMNLLLNAIQAIDGRGTIYLKTWSDKQMVHVSVRDTGPGVSKEIKDKIFDPFFTTKHAGKGTGLGLSISYGIVQKHRGTIRLESSDNKGAEFVVSLPLTQRKKQCPDHE